MNVIYVVLAVIGFALLHLSDPIAIKRIPLAKPAVWTTGMGLLLYAAVRACLSTDKFDLPAWTTWFGWILLGISSPLVVVSLFLNLPFRKTYITTGIGDRLVTSGFYALTRHPGVLWTVLLLLSLVLVSKSYVVLAAAPLIILVDVLLVAIQDRFFFGRMFEGYADYRKATPMLIPNVKSIRAFVAWLKRACELRSARGENHDFELS